MIIVDLIFNLALLVSASILSGFIDHRWKRDTKSGIVLQGLLFGMVALLGMMNPFVLTPGIIFDGRSVVLSLCALFFGPVSGLIAAALAMVYRIYLGGNGVYMGILVIITSTLTGVVYHNNWKRKQRRSNIFYLYGFGMIVHIVMVLLIFTLPSPMRIVTFKILTFSILGVYPLATVLIGKLLKDQSDSSGRKAAEEALQDSEHKFALFMDHLPAIAFIKDVDFKTIYVNKQLEQTLGASTWLGLMSTEYFPGDFGEKLLADDNDAVDSGFVKVEEMVTDVNGRDRYFEIQKFIIPREGKAPLLGGIAIDITERKHAAELLNEKATELERSNNLMINREIRMIELKKEINELLVYAGKNEKYTNYTP
ncbi:MAG: LytS/YhcK type 5TM receptor domain-containing protein [Bacteroidales bacterium]|nr:LytS/YhcK type 5TM receptor domain-containing protein [Bacteroidales bacterium]